MGYGGEGRRIEEVEKGWEERGGKGILRNLKF